MREPWKILYTIPNFDTAGSGKALLNIASRLDKTCYEPHICCSHARGIFFKEIVASGLPVRLHQTTLDMIRRRRGLLSCIKLARYFRSLKVDLIHSFHYGPDYSEPLAARLAGIPWVYTKKNMNWGGKSKNGWKMRTALASYILAQNKDMITKFFPGRKNVSLIPRGVDTEEFSPKPKNKKLLKEYRIRKDEKVILTVANLVPIKGIGILLDAFEALSKNCDSIKLFIVGDKENDYGREIEDKAIQSPFSAKIYFTGKVQNVSDYYSIADVFVLPTLDEGGEGCPVSLLEAMASGSAVVASDVSGVRDILEPFPGTMFPAGDVVKLKNTIDDFLRMPFSEHPSRALRTRIIEDFNIDTEVSHHHTIYQHCLNP